MKESGCINLIPIFVFWKKFMDWWLSRAGTNRTQSSGSLYYYGVSFGVNRKNFRSLWRRKPVHVMSYRGSTTILLKKFDKNHNENLYLLLNFSHLNMRYCTITASELLEKSAADSTHPESMRCLQKHSRTHLYYRFSVHTIRISQVHSGMHSPFVLGEETKIALPHNPAYFLEFSSPDSKQLG